MAKTKSKHFFVDISQIIDILKGSKKKKHKFLRKSLKNSRVLGFNLHIVKLITDEVRETGVHRMD